MEAFGVLAFLAIVAIIVLVVLFALPAAIVSMLLSPGKAIWVILFIIAKKCNWIKISWWWILLGLLIPF